MRQPSSRSPSPWTPTARRVRVEVSDAAAGYPAPQEPVADAPHGRGLHIVQTLADAWGVEMQRDRTGKTVWFSMRLAAADGPTTRTAPGRLAPPAQRSCATTRSPRRPRPWRQRHCARALVARPGRPRGARRLAATPSSPPTSTERSATSTSRRRGSWAGPTGRSPAVPPSIWCPTHCAAKGSSTDSKRSFDHRAEALLGRRLPAVIKRADGSDVHTELVLSMFDHPLAGRVIVGILRSRDDRKLQRWSELTSELLEILADAPIDDPPAERLLSTLGRRLDWDVTTLWALAADEQLICRHVWTRTPTIAPAFAREKAADPTSGSEGLPRWVVEHGEPLWVPDLMRDRRFVTDSLVKDRLQSAYAFPIRYRGEVPRDRQDAEPVPARARSLGGGADGRRRWPPRRVAARLGPGGRARAARRRAPRGPAAQRVPAARHPGALRGRPTTARWSNASLRSPSPSWPTSVSSTSRTRTDGCAAWRPGTQTRRSDRSPRSSATRIRPTRPGVHPTIEVMRSGRSKWSADMDDEFLRATSRDDRHYAILKTLGFTSYMTVPLRLPDHQVLGTVTLVSAGSGRRFSEKDLGLAEQLAEQVSSVVIRARAYDRERRISHELQRHLLPDAIPSIDGLGRGRALPAGGGGRRGRRRLVRRGAHRRAPGRARRRRRRGPRPRRGQDHEPAPPHARPPHPRGAGAREGAGAAQPGLAVGRWASAWPRRSSACSTRRPAAISFSSAGHPSPVRIESRPGPRAARPAGTAAGRPALPLQGPRVPAWTRGAS